MKKTFFLLGILLLLGLFLRTFRLWDNIFFGYDQARDMQRIFEIIKSHDIKIVGPETDIPGIFNGPFFYYLMAPIYLISNFNSNVSALFLVLINLTGVLIIYNLAKSLFNERVALISSLIWAISYEQANFAKFISNASLMPLFSLIFFAGLSFCFVKKQNLGLIISAIGFALSIQVNFYLVYLCLFYPILYFIYFPKINYKTIFSSLLVFIILTSSFVISELKFHFLATKSLFKYFQGQNIPSYIGEDLLFYFQSLSKVLYNSIFSFSYFVIFLVFIVFLVYLFKKEGNKPNIKFLLIWLFSTLPLFAFKSNVVGGPVIQTSIFGAIYIFFAVIIDLILSRKKYVLIGYLLIFIIIISNIKLYTNEDFKNNKILAYQNMFYGDQKKLIEYTYKSSNNKKFSICAVSNPLFINVLWSVLYKTYGEDKYGFSPVWSGQKQYLIPSLIDYDLNHEQIRFMIIEPTLGIIDNAKKATIYLEDQVTIIEEVKKFGEITVQKRRFTNNKNLLKDSQNLSASEIETVKILITDPRYTCSIEY